MGDNIRHHFECICDNVEPEMVGKLCAFELYRAKVPGGWLVLHKSEYSERGGLTFLPDPHHTWDGKPMAHTLKSSEILGLDGLAT